MSSLLSSCFKDTTDEGGIETRLYGSVLDTNNNIPVTNLKIRIAEYNDVPNIAPGNQEDFIQFIDSTTTDSNGNYDVTFTNSGLGDTYYITAITNDSIYAIESSSIEFDELGEDLQFDFRLLHLYPMNLTVKLDTDVQYTPIRMRPEYTGLGELNKLKFVDVDYSRSIYTDKNTSELIRFTRRDTLTGDYQIAEVIIPETNTTSATQFDIFLREEDFRDQ
ncbi:hypothetical protein ULMS_28360 [Patiriisocius marinistellae]|uniref:Uncharacterized protein n=1 Tax=Patiriisocius marinistellae TaxID=2494560 RepID=A0A5J4G0Q3_9FLAO|nr:hypothetical protein ULMS_28360 [Patiriisocius marinistellae]